MLGAFGAFMGTLERIWTSKGDIGSILVPPTEISETHRVDFVSGSSRAKLQQRCNNNESRACIMHASKLVYIYIYIYIHITYYEIGTV